MLFDAELLEEVGYRLVARCKGILQVSDAISGRVHCRKCSPVILRLRYNRPGEDDEIMQCPRCGWQMPWAAYFQSFSGRKLRGGEVVHIYAEFVKRFQNAKSPQEKSSRLTASSMNFTRTWESRPNPSL